MRAREIIGEMSSTGRLTWIVALAFLIRVAAAGFGGPITADGVLFYLPSAAGILDGDWSRGIPPTHHPLYPLLIALLQLFGVAAELAGRGVSVVAGALAVIPFFLIGRRIGGDRCGWIAALLITFLPQHIRYSGWVQTETLYTLFVALALERSICIAQGASWRSAVAAGMWSALAILTRGEGILLIALPVAAVFLRQERGRAWLGAGVAVAIGVTAAGAITAKFSMDLDHWAYSPWSNNGFILGETDDFSCLFAIAPGGDRLMFYERLTPEGFDPDLKGRRILENPGTFMISYGRRAGEFLVRQAPKSIPWPWLVVMIFGFGLCLRGFSRVRSGLSAWRRNEHRVRLLLLMLFCLLGAAFPAYFVQKRFWLSFAPATMGAAALGFAWLLESSRSQGTRFAALGFFMAGIFPCVEVFQVDAGWNASVARHAALELRDHVDLPARAHLLADRHELPYYAGMRSSELPMAPWKESLDYAVARGARGILVERGDARKRGWLEPMQRLATVIIPYRDAEYLCLVFP